MTARNLRTALAARLAPSAPPAIVRRVGTPAVRSETLAPGVTLYLGDSLDVLPTLPGVHSVVSDAPYGLGEHPDPMALLRAWMAGQPYVPRGRGGFMGKDWDAFVPGPEFWAPCFDLLPPGGHMLTAFGTRTYDIGTLAVRLAGMEIRDLVAWLYGSGFPKSLNVAKAIASGTGRPEDIRRMAMGDAYEPSGRGRANYDHGSASAMNGEWSGWGTALKPALEPWVLARKPLSGTVAANVQAHGVGGLNIDACRVVRPDGDTSGWSQTGSKASDNLAMASANYVRAPAPDNPARWPANVIHDGSDAVLAGFPDAKGQQGDLKGHNTARTSPNGVYGTFGPAGDRIARGDTGSAARFFYCAKASKRDRDEGNNHPTVKPTELMRYLCRLITPPGGVVLDPFMGSGSTGKAAVLEGFGFIGIERDPAYYEIALRRIAAAVREVRS